MGCQFSSFLLPFGQGIAQFQASGPVEKVLLFWGFLGSSTGGDCEEDFLITKQLYQIASCLLCLHLRLALFEDVK